DTSTGGTTPTGTVDLSGVGEPAAYYHSDGTNLFMRFNLQGPPLALSGSSQPYVSASWTVLLDTDSDAFKEFAIMLDGMSGGSPDKLYLYYNDASMQTVGTSDYIAQLDSVVYSGSFGSAANWDVDSDPYIWDF